MIEIYGDMWDKKYNGYVRCITTNGFIKNNGACVMGKGTALQAATLYPNLPKLLGTFVKHYGNHVHELISGEIVSFPTKHYWWDKSDTSLIIRSCKELMSLVINSDWHKILLPRPGCSNGGLTWKMVHPICQKYLDDRVTIISYEENYERY